MPPTWRGAGAGILAALLTACDPCGNELRERLASPDEELEVYVFQRSCGVTTRFGTQVSVEPFGKRPPGGEGNVFQMVRPDSVSSAPIGGLVAEPRWLGPRALEISYDARAEVTWAVSQWGDLRISYVPMQ